mgnify:CR=1 FL=1
MTERALLLGVLLAGCASDSDYAPLPHAANALSAVVLDEALYVLGGHHGGAHASSVENMDDVFLRLDLTDSAATWEELEAPGDPVQQATLFVYDGEVHRLGGLTSTHSPGETKDLWTLDTHAVFRGDTWVELDPMPETRASHALALIDDTIFVVGGWTLAGPADDFLYSSTFLSKDLADPDAEWLVRDQPWQYRDLCGGAFEGKVYALGGMLSGSFPKSTRVFDPATEAWSDGPDLPSTGGMNGFGCAAAHDDEDLFFTHKNGTVYTLADGGMGWEEAATMKQPRTFHSVALRGEHELIAVGGSDGGTQGEFDAVESIPLD